MIVIAVAALIIVLILVAAPVLQRNARNTQRRNDVALFSAALQNAANNSSEFPDADRFNSDVLTSLEPSIYKEEDGIPHADAVDLAGRLGFKGFGPAAYTENIPWLVDGLALVAIKPIRLLVY